jgi:hypothetical protein
MHAVRYLGELTRCKSWIFEDLHQARGASIGFDGVAALSNARGPAFMFHFTNPHEIILVCGEAGARLFENQHKKTKRSP